MTRWCRLITLWLSVLLLTVGYADTQGNSALKNGNGTDNGALTLETLELKIQGLAAKTELSAEVKTKLQTRYTAIKENLNNSAQFKTQADAYQDTLQMAALTLKQLQTDINRLEARNKQGISENFQTIPTDELEQRYSLEKSKLSTLDAELKHLDNELLLHNNRLSAIRSETATAQQALEVARQQLATFLPGAESKLEIEANQLYLNTLIEARTQELKQYELETLSNPLRIQLLKAELQLLSLKRSNLEPIISAIEEQLASRRQAEADKINEVLSQTEKEIADKPGVIQRNSRENIQYSRDTQAISLKLAQYADQKAEIDSSAAAIAQNFKSADKKISLAGLSPALGKILREQRRNLLFKDDFFLQAEELQNDTATASLAQFKVEDKLKQLNAIDFTLNQLIREQVDPNLPSSQRLRIKAELRIVLNTQKELLTKLSSLYVDYLRLLGDVDFARQQLLKQARQYAAYLDQRLLWVPSALPIGLDYPLQVYQSLRWLLTPNHWLRLSQDLITALSKYPLLSLVALISLTVLQLFKTKIKALLLESNSQVSRAHTDRFHYTLKSLGLTFILVAPLALCSYYLGWFLNQDRQLAHFSKVVGSGLCAAAIPLFFIQFYGHLFTPDGFIRKHFAWRKTPTAVLLQQFRLLRYTLVPATFIIAMTNAAEPVQHTDTLGRLALLVSLLALSVGLANIFQRKAEMFPKAVRDNPEHWLTKFHFIWYPVIISIPLIIAGFAVSGYYLSAIDLQQKLIVTLRILFIGVIGHQLMIRWLSIVNRQLTLRNMRRTLNDTPESRTPNLTEELIDIPAVNAQTLHILNAVIALSVSISIWMVWKNILPAFAFLEQVVLWQHKVVLEGQEVYQPITLTNLIFALMYAALAIITVKNLPGLMELAVFRRFDIEAGSRYAVNQLSKYFILAIAVISIANELGGSWSQVQWLAAALSVGLGFGLQEIFANLVSGIILLFERPIRVGDTVTVGDITGTVNRIQMRATTLIDNDQKELIVPNKTFITNQLVNWTLTDSITRVVIPVGIAYGSDVALAHNIMRETIAAMPQVLAEPEPSVLLVGFGDNALNFSIRLFVGKLAERPRVTHELHLRLEQAFRVHNISIPFPQRDIYLHHAPLQT